MAASEFHFSVRVTSGERFDDVLSDVTATVFQHLGYTSASVSAVVAELQRAIAAVDQACEVRFRARRPACEIVVVVGDREVWKASPRLS